MGPLMAILTDIGVAVTLLMVLYAVIWTIHGVSGLFDDVREIRKSICRKEGN
jgi:hypothetical protein